MSRILFLLICLPLVWVQAYDPLTLPEADLPDAVDLSIQDIGRNREIPLRIWLPIGKEPAPVILFSHGLGGSREGNAYLGRHWAGRGYVVVFLQHAGSDESVWKDVPRRERLKSLKAAAGLQQTLDRFNDVKAVLDALPTLKPCEGRVDMNRVGMSGHSFGAVTTQGVSGQTMGRRSFTDDRIKAAVVMSPSLPRRGDADKAFAKVSVPWFLMTGTEDKSPIDPRLNPESRAQVFDHLPKGDHLLLVLKGAEHFAFGDSRRRNRNRNPNHHRVILALTTAFWDLHLKSNDDAGDWLQSEAAADLMEEGDVLQRKQEQ